ncbi:hypothetical protein L9F63_003432 [Diploptera punctata]|uniref:Gamma-glutamyltransferase n=1 Tax=Diploptera punctata TaxID=6984 RepID=A0AAD8EA22_DIPPU|nr:hypothetical protein L9F63_003432 [Diploptera punctata]
MLTLEEELERKPRYFRTSSEHSPIEQHRQKKIVIITGVTMLVLIIVSLSWELPFLLNNNEEEKVNVEVEPPPSTSKEGFYLRAALSADSTVCPPIGRRILEKGGSAVDAAIAVLFCQGVADPHRSGIGGGMYMLIYQREKRSAVSIDARESAPSLAHADMFQENRNGSFKGGMSIAVPGELLGLWEAHKRFGVIPWKNWWNHPYIYPVQEMFTNPNTGEVLKSGDIMKNHRLGKTLRMIAESGPSCFYNGSLTTELIADIQRAGGILQPSDLHSYKVRWSEPISNTVLSDGEELVMFTSPPPSGGVVLTNILNILKGYNMGPQDNNGTSNQAITLHRIIEAFKFSYAKRSLLGDPMFVNVTQTVDELLSKTHAEAERQKIDDYKTVNDISFYGSVFSQPEDSGTTHICVVAPNGDAVSATSTINYNFGSGVMSNSTGILLNDEMDDFNLPSNTNNEETLPFSANFNRLVKDPLINVSCYSYK